MDIKAIAERYQKLKQEVDKFSKNIKIVVVTKYVDDAEIIAELINCGITDIGESYAQQLQQKYDKLKEMDFPVEKYTWHFIGHLQKNKVKKVVPICDYIQSLDSIELAYKINQLAKQCNKIQNCLVELKVSHEESKFGIEEEEIFLFCEQLVKSNLTNIKLVGLMTMAPYFENPNETRPYFKKAYKVFCELKNKIDGFEIFSAGMSNDYIVALEEGSNMIRVGSLIFESVKV